jgi:hypothetical protein
MPDICRLYLDQMLRYEVAQALRDEGHDVLRATVTVLANCEFTKLNFLQQLFELCHRPSFL